MSAQLAGIQRALVERLSTFLQNPEIQLRKDYQSLLTGERDFWLSKSRTTWLLEGERNTNFFHTTTLMNKKRNKILSLKLHDYTWCFDQEILKSTKNDLFCKLYSSETMVQQGPILEIPYSKPLLSEGILSLLEPVSPCKILRALKCLKSKKSPGPDGLHGLFYQKHWSALGNSISNLVKDFFKDKDLLVGLNDTLIVPIPKCKHPESIS